MTEIDFHRSIGGNGEGRAKRDGFTHRLRRAFNGRFVTKSFIADSSAASGALLPTVIVP